MGPTNPEEPTAECLDCGAEEVQRPGRRNLRRPRRVMCEAGVQGPVHYTGVGRTSGGNYQHIVQGFRRGDEVTRVVADRPQERPEGAKTD